MNRRLIKAIALARAAANTYSGADAELVDHLGLSVAERERAHAEVLAIANRLYERAVDLAAKEGYDVDRYNGLLHRPGEERKVADEFSMRARGRDFDPFAQDPASGPVVCREDPATPLESSDWPAAFEE